jgi:hypothetical protein
MILTNFYASTAILGALVFLALHAWGVSAPVQLFGTTATTTALRILAMHTNLQLPGVRRLDAPDSRQESNTRKRCSQPPGQSDWPLYPCAHC